MAIHEGFFDVQVNGYGGIDFNSDDVTAEQLHGVCQRLDDDGVDGILATVITDTLDRMIHRLQNIVRYRQADPLIASKIAGIHIEGPFISGVVGFRGAHPEDAIHPANGEEMRRLLEAAGGLTRIVTLAPENDPGLAVTKMLSGMGIVVSGGHSDASVEQLKAAADAGMSMYTHLGNGCPMQMHRHDNIIQRVLSLRDRLWISFICDGAHIPFVALGNYLRLVGLERAVVTSDCVAPAGLGPGRYRLGRWELEIGEDLIPWAPDRSHFVGSGITMRRSASNLAALGFTDREIHRMACVNPRRCIGLDVSTASPVQ